ncbi:P2X purinoceptor 7-like [Ostrea edulis]|uniref:P2X purinoceptor 7-like n=1 Tax=Ostrea edulis TaxID=37623 RepID=UPI0024AFD256|nr:P2X purinoceptor 7-like [Ostrea edulis]
MANVRHRDSRSSTSSDIGLHMSFEVSSCDDSDGEDLQDIVPYQFEPEASESNESEQDSSLGGSDEDQPRLDNTDWCTCGYCVLMPTQRESICCCEIDRVNSKKDSSDRKLSCITQHPGFSLVCLDVYVLETAYYQYRSQYGELQTSIEERNRYTSYRQLVRWCWGYLGKNVRVPLPSCAIQKIRAAFPSEDYEGFRDPQ